MIKREIMNQETYAPVIIPTLNRYDHLRRCINSLAKCTHASETEVIIGLDYPPSDKYIEGWKNICDYLPTISGFKKVTVLKREKNYGALHNSLDLEEYVSKDYDYYIYSEDDNEFSPNFLDFMNKGLKKYNSDPRVIRISAYTSPVFSNVSKTSVFFGIDTPGYGLGAWPNKLVKTKEIDLDKYLKSLSFRKFIKFFFIYPSLISMVIDMFKRKVFWGDVHYSMNNLLFGTFTLQPSISLARNWGNDGSGINCGINEKIAQEVIDTHATFNMDDIPFECTKEIINRCRHRNMPSNPLRYPLSLGMKLCRAIRYYFA